MLLYVHIHVIYTKIYKEIVKHIFFDKKYKHAFANIAKNELLPRKPLIDDLL